MNILLNSSLFAHTPIVGLFCTSSPLTIIKTVATIIVYSINCGIGSTKLFNVFKIRFMHIITKVSKIIYPTLTYSYSTPSVVLPSFIRRICCPLEYVCPNVVKRANLALGEIVLSIITFLSRLSFKTSTTYRATVFNMSLCNSLYSSTIANKFPTIISFFAHKLNGCEPSKSLSCNIFHNFIPEMVGRFVSILPFLVTKLIIPTSYHNHG